MADNIINPNSAMSEGISLDNFSGSSSPESGLEERFMGLMLANNEDVFLPDQAAFANPEGDAGSATGSEWNRFEIEQPVVEDLPPVVSPKAYDFNGKPVLGENIDSVSEGSIGDKILRGMQGVREHVEESAQQVETHLRNGSETMSMREMFQTQWTMSKLMITEDYIGKVISKGTQAFDTLLRNQ